MYAITESLVKLAQELNVTFITNAKVQQIITQNNLVKGIIVNDHTEYADIVICNMDIVNAYKKLLPNEKQPDKILTQPKSSSALIFYFGINRLFPQLDVHNIFFSKNYKEEFDTIFNKKTIYSDPTIYINITSKECPQDAPPNAENWFTMINVPNNSGQDWDNLIPQARQAVLSKLNRMLKTDLHQYIAQETILEPRTIESRTSSSQGALYGNSSNNRYAAFLRHANFSTKIKHLYFCGGSVHPGGGIPLSLSSAKIVADLVKKLEK
jgi:phytoene desaturase